jgi:hypothetical protein
MFEIDLIFLLISSREKSLTFERIKKAIEKEKKRKIDILNSEMHQNNFLM